MHWRLQAPDALKGTSEGEALEQQVSQADSAD